MAGLTLWVSRFSEVELGLDNEMLLGFVTMVPGNHGPGGHWVRVSRV